MQDQKCRWRLESESKYDPCYECREDPLPNDPDGYCILHSEDEAKDLKKEFTDKVTSRIRKTANKEEIDLIGCYFPKCFDTAFFEGRTFKKYVNFNNAKFAKIDFSKAKFLQGANFYRVKFSEQVLFSKTSFEGGMTTFREAKFNDVSFNGTLFRGEEVSFSDTRFIGKTDFDAPHFYGQVYFLRTQFKKYCKFRWIEIRTTQPPIFEDSTLSNCSFLHSNIDKVDFRHCKFEEKPRKLLFVLSHSRQNVLRDEEDCDNGNVEVSAELEKMPPDVKFPNSIASKIHYDAKIERLVFKGVMSKNEKNELLKLSSNPQYVKAIKELFEKPYEQVRRLYVELKRNFEEKKDWNTAGDFHYGEMECRRKMKEGWLKRNIVSLEALYYWASGYGERPLWAFVILTLLVMVVFPLLLSMDVLVRHQSFCLWNFGWALYNSVGYSLEVATFTRVMRIGEPIQLDTGWDKWVLVSESILVYIQILLFALALRRKVKR